MPKKVQVETSNVTISCLRKDMAEMSPLLSLPFKEFKTEIDLMSNIGTLLYFHSQLELGREKANYVLERISVLLKNPFCDFSIMGMISIA